MEPVYRAAYSTFIGLTVNSFSAGSVVADTDLLFSSCSSTPSTDSISTTIQTAISGGSLSLNIISFRVNSAPTVVLQVVLTIVYTEALSNPQSQEFQQEQAAQVIAVPAKDIGKCLRWIKLCGRPHQQLNVNKLRNHGTAKHFYVCSNFHFVEGKPTQDHPDPLPASPFDRPSSVRRPPKLRKEPRKSATAETMSVIMEHQGPTPHTLDRTPHTLDPAPLTQDLTPHTQDDDGSGLLDMLALAAENDTLKMQCDAIYRTQYGTLFVRTIVVAFRPSSRNRVDDVETVPDSADIANTLKEAVSDPTSNYTLPVNVDSIMVTSAPRTASNVQFATNDTFNTALSNSSSTAFKDRASLIKQQLEPFFIEDFTPLFISLNAKSFSRGSIIHESDLTFTANVTLPSSTAIYNTMLRAAQSGNLTFTITTLNGTAVSSAVVSAVWPASSAPGAWWSSLYWCSCSGWLSDLSIIEVSNDM
ncbi:hypothetical protein AALO_G00090220 [Alosa alosa]|uniref:SEA domain-containing protein n=1 Tax=Alosa alosa TaxID=278164 RepID=A0AAV6GR52_9TELE|nr:hypothetical protein AALO_G00090220 [Alosa alosa]